MAKLSLHIIGLPCQVTIKLLLPIDYLISLDTVSFAAVELREEQALAC